MLKSLYTLSEKLKKKKIVIYGINRSSVIVFSKLALDHQVDVDSFWDADDRFVGGYFIDRRIISTVQLHQMQDVAVVIPEAYERYEVQVQAGADAEVFYMEEILDLNSGLEHKKIYIYGIGSRGEQVYDALSDKGITIEGIAVTRPGRITGWCDKEVLPIGQIEQGPGCAVIIATDIERFQKEMLAQIHDLKVEKYIVSYMSDNVITEGNFFQIINLALIQHRDIWLYGCRDEHCTYLEEILERYQIPISNRVCGDSIYDLEYEDIDRICVLVAENDDQKMEQVCDILDDIGFGLEYWDYTATGLCTCRAGMHAKIKRDVLIGNSVFETERYPGYVVYGDEERAKVKLMVLGGSTSTENVFRTVSWVRFLYEKLSDAGYSPVIFNGAVCGYGIVDEFLHVLRDIEPIRPDIVISFSGVNNTCIRKTLNQFNTSSAERVIKKNGDHISGVKSNETLYDFWYRISKLMRSVAEQYCARTFHFLQPMSAVKEDLDLTETGMFDHVEHTVHMRGFRDRALVEEDQFYIDLISMFEGQNVFIDSTHYCTNANRMIAEKVFEAMEKDLEMIVGGSGAKIGG